MHKAFTQIFWGFLIIFIEIHLFVIDILPDPLGYALICMGIGSLTTDYPIGKKAYKIALILAVLSIPGVFLQQNAGDFSASSLNGWGLYTMLLHLLNLVMTFYIFQLLMVIAKRYGGKQLIHRTSVFFKIYMVTMLCFQIFHTFTINMYGDFLIGYTIITAGVTLLLQIVFLAWIFYFRKLGELSVQSESI